jgi:hypothetical protein
MKAPSDPPSHLHAGREPWTWQNLPAQEAPIRLYSRPSFSFPRLTAQPGSQLLRSGRVSSGPLRRWFPTRTRVDFWWQELFVESRSMKGKFSVFPLASFISWSPLGFLPHTARVSASVLFSSLPQFPTLLGHRPASHSYSMEEQRFEPRGSDSRPCYLTPALQGLSDPGKSTHTFRTALAPLRFPALIST